MQILQWHKFEKANKEKFLLLIGFVILALAVRLYYNSGPLYVLGDEGIYLNIISQSVVFKSHPLSLLMYRNANFSNPLETIFNPANIFKFYAGFLYPELLINDIFSYSAANVIYYVTFWSLIECIFLFLIIEAISNRRAAIIGALLFSFFPLDVILSIRVLPIIPMIAMLTIAVYLFIKRKKSEKTKTKYIYSLLSGFFVGLAYLVHPEGVILLPFLILYSLVTIISNKSVFREEIRNISFTVIGAFLAFSITGIWYFMITGNFFLYPEVDHNVFLYQSRTQSLYNISIGSNAVLSYTTGTPLNYVNMLFRLELTKNLFPVEHGLFYFSVIGYLAVAFGTFLLLKSKNSQQRMFVYLFIFYLAALSFTPTNISTNSRGQVMFLMVNSDVIYSSILILPLTIIIALGLEQMFSTNIKGVKYVAVGIITCCVVVSIMQLNYDSTIFRNSMYDVNQFVKYVSLHSSGVFYAQPTFAQEAQDISRYRYLSSIRPLFSCSASNIAKINDSYFVVGGTLSISWTPAIMQSYNNCVTANLTNANLVYNASNPYEPSNPLRIFKQNVTS